VLGFVSFSQTGKLVVYTISYYLITLSIGSDTKRPEQRGRGRAGIACPEHRMEALVG